jgi:pimeloyl-ACP methyl ester carboxylesterase
VDERFNWSEFNHAPCRSCSLRRCHLCRLGAAGVGGIKSIPFKPEVRYAQVGEIKLAYYIRGEGQPLVMINGFLTMMSMWDPALIQELAKHNKLILFDNRGVGFSTDTKTNNTTMEQMADDTAGLIRALGLKKANVLGYSMGARIGQQLIIRQPELINKAVLAGPNPGGSHQDPAARDVEAELNSPNVPFTTSKETIARLDRAHTTLWKANNSNFQNLKNVKIPVLVTDGRSDVVDPPKNSRMIANQIPFAWLAFLKAAIPFFSSLTRSLPTR